MDSYNIGSIFGFMQGAKWSKKSPACKPDEEILNIAENAYSNQLFMFASLNKQDFIDGFYDGCLSAYKQELLYVA